MSARNVSPGRPGFQVHRLGGFAVVGLPAGFNELTALSMAGELCAALNAGVPGLNVDLSGAGSRDSAYLDALMRAAGSARGWQSWLRVVIPDYAARKTVRLVALDEVMPVHASVTEAVMAACLETARGEWALSAPAWPSTVSQLVPTAGRDADLLTISVSSEQSSALVVLVSEADLTVSDQLGQALTAQVLAGRPNLVIDWPPMHSIDSSCLHVLARVCRMAEEAGGTFGLAVPQPVVARTMQLWGAYRTIPVHTSVRKAIIAGPGVVDVRVGASREGAVIGEPVLISTGSAAGDPA